MILTQTAEYAMRAMAAVAMTDENCPCRTRDISHTTGIPSHYLSKIMRKLVEAGLLLSKKGHGGGFVMARPPEEIRFIQILEAVDFDVEPTGCAFGWGACDASNPCPLHPAWAKLKSGFSVWAESHTLADISKTALSEPIVH